MNLQCVLDHQGYDDREDSLKAFISVWQVDITTRLTVTKIYLHLFCSAFVRAGNQLTCEVMQALKKR